MNIIHGDCLEELKKLEDNSIDAVVCDPPYGLSNTKPQQVADVLKAWVTGDTVSVPAKKGGFMGKDWDSFVPPPAVWEECMRVLKPGGHMAVFAGARTQDLMGLSIRLAGFRIKDNIGWIFGSGFPKSHNPFKGLKLCPSIENAPHAVQVSQWHHHELNGEKEPIALALAEIMPEGEKALLTKTGKGEGSQDLTVTYLSDITGKTFSNIDLSWQKHSEESWKHMSMSIIKTIADQITESKTLNFLQSKITGKYTPQKGTGEHGSNCRVARVVNFFGESGGSISDTLMPTVVDAVTSPVFGMRSQGTQLKPAIEPIILAQKPLDGTVANNVLAHGVGGLNIDACRVPSDAPIPSHHGTSGAAGVTMGKYRDYVPGSETAASVENVQTAGRFPANVLLDEHAAKEMDKQSGPAGAHGESRGGGTRGMFGWQSDNRQTTNIGVGGASRFFPVFKYQAKAPKKERPVIEREDGTKIQHNTGKPLALMEWLVSWIVPPGGVVLDPFAGSGTTLQAALNKGFQPIGIEQDADYIKLIEKRLEGLCTTHKN